ncbi:succinyl-diaminopimelate desuccinylase [Jannaschia sp. W003]|uniref:succinyl-diaminopimelate desuccinylase n=1 Tax=Jannaschia sp. W003 TaxID=2867012 RepID=UPI0021A5EADB|nr:succinyl-diaminopimelate desuccinylase [Jannaschia sp. W003]UWQ22192.1 succinyl-diaminopimelate desuccinylase [Jannaschia sp. W003]
MSVDAVDLAARLVRCPSVTPEEGGALTLLTGVLEEAGFRCTRVDRNGTPNLFARWGERGARTFGFNGHTDVVPVGDAEAWTRDPFGGEIADGWLHGRGATDMKSGVAAFAAAACDFVRETFPDGAVILAITGDEEGPSTDGTVAILDWMEAEGERMDACLVGEPTCPEHMGDMIKIGRRGSLSAWLTVEGVQGHAAYPHRAVNPVQACARLCDRLASHAMDKGTEHFDPSTLQVVTIDTGNPATNVIPARCRATVNVRFNDAHDSHSVLAWIRAEADRVEGETGARVSLETKVSGESFLTPPGPLSDLVAAAVTAETNRTPVLSTSGGTSDARFVRNHCPVVEFGLVGHRMHAVDERCRVEQIEALKRVYGRVLRGFFEG